MLAFAAATHSLAFVLFDGDSPKDWQISGTAVQSGAQAAAFARLQIGRYNPDVVVVEDIDKAERKGERAKAAIRAIKAVAANHEVYDVAVPRTCQFSSKYDEAKAFGLLYPELAPWVPPKRRRQDVEHRNVSLFEAVWLAEAVIFQAGTRLLKET